MRTIRQYLNDVLEELQLVETFTRDGQEHFLADDKTQYAVIRAYEVIGEIIKRLPSELLDTHPEIDWQSIKGFRDFLIHNYHRVTPERVWDAVNDLPNLKTAVESILTNITDE